MRYVSFEKDGKAFLGVREGGAIRTLGEVTLEELLAQGVDLSKWAATQQGGRVEAEDGLKFLPPLRRPTKILCVGLNFKDHSKVCP